jgi:Xaa-Pro dipeptidase
MDRCCCTDALPCAAMDRSDDSGKLDDDADRQRVVRLRDAENRARQLFAECVRQGLIVAGKTERGLSDEVRQLACAMFGVRRFWHKRIVRAGRNTLLPYAENPPDLTIQPDDIVFFDFGPVFEDWEADLGLTFVLGDDPRKHALAGDVARAWDEAAEHFRRHPDLTAAGLYGHVTGLARRHGWEFGHIHCGHLIGRFPHEKIEGDDESRYLRSDNPTQLRGRGTRGEALRWILEIHFVDRAAGFGGFQEAMLCEASEL